MRVPIHTKLIQGIVSTGTMTMERICADPYLTNGIALVSVVMIRTVRTTLVMIGQTWRRRNESSISLVLVDQWRNSRTLAGNEPLKADLLLVLFHFIQSYFYKKQTK